MRKSIALPADSKPATLQKPEKPRPDFPLFAHATKRWAKKIRGKTFYFGPWGDPGGAEAAYLAQAEDLYAGRKPYADNDPETLTVKRLGDMFLTSKRQDVMEGRLTPRSFHDYLGTLKRFSTSIGKHRPVTDLKPGDFSGYRSELVTARKLGPTTVANEIRRLKTLFRWGYENDHLQQPMKFGSSFAPESKKLLRRLGHLNGDHKVFAAEEIRLMLDAAPVHLRAMILLGINAAFGNHDCGALRLESLDLAEGWVSQARSKTGIDRRAKLWPETIEALRASLENRPAPASTEAADLVFLTRTGEPWLAKPSYDAEEGTYVGVINSALSAEFRKLLRGIDRARAKAAKKAGQPAPAPLHRRGCGFYSLRHSFRTLADQALDPGATNMVMGHVDQHISSVYTHNAAPAVKAMFDRRLDNVAAFVREWLFPPKAGTATVEVAEG